MGLPPRRRRHALSSNDVNDALAALELEMPRPAREIGIDLDQINTGLKIVRCNKVKLKTNWL
jgi:hypothetical protein